MPISRILPLQGVRCAAPDRRPPSAGSTGCNNRPDVLELDDGAFLATGERLGTLLREREGRNVYRLT
ncbi:hypothetical protein [Streptomyces sp. NPDC001070]